MTVTSRAVPLPGGGQRDVIKYRSTVEGTVAVELASWAADLEASLWEEIRVQG